MVQAKLVRIWNSRGIRLTKPLLEVARLVDEVDIEAEAACDAEGLLDDMTATRFDDEEWAW